MDQCHDLDVLKIDVLKEMASIGVGNAMTALSRMLGDRKITMHVPEVKVVHLQELADFLGGDEQVVTAICFEAKNEKMLLNLLFVMSVEAAANMVSLLIPDPTKRSSEMSRSALMEIGTVVAGSYLSAISAMTNLTFVAPPPSLAEDMAGAVMSTVVAENRMMEDSIIILKTFIHTESEKIDGDLLILPDFGSMDLLFKLLGV